MAKRSKASGIIIAVLAVILAMAVTNPGQTDFENYLSGRAKASVQKDGPGGALGDLAGGIASSFAQLGSLGYQRRDYFVFSVFSPKSGSGKSYLGLFKGLFVEF